MLQLADLLYTQLRIIPEHKIVKQELVRSVTARKMATGQKTLLSSKVVDTSEYSITIHHRTGYLGKLRVSYKTFSSGSDDASVEVCS